MNKLILALLLSFSMTAHAQVSGPGNTFGGGGGGGIGACSTPLPASGICEDATGNLVLNDAGAGIIATPAATTGSNIVLSEGTNFGTSTVTLGLGGTDLSGSVNCVIDSGGGIPAGCALLGNIVVGGSPIASQNAGVALTANTAVLNFTGDGVTASNVGTSVSIDVPVSMDFPLSSPGATGVAGAKSYYRFESNGVVGAAAGNLPAAGDYANMTLVTSVNDALQTADPIINQSLSASCASSGDCIRLPLVKDASGVNTPTMYRVDMTLTDLGASGNHCGMQPYENNNAWLFREAGTNAWQLAKFVNRSTKLTKTGTASGNGVTSNPHLAGSSAKDANFREASVYTLYSTTPSQGNYTFLGAWRTADSVATNPIEGCDWADNDGSLVVEIWRIAP